MGKKLDASDNQKGRKQKIILANCIRRNLSSNRPSCENDAAKIQIIRIREEAIKAFKQLRPFFLRNPDSKINYSRPNS